MQPSESMVPELHIQLQGCEHDADISATAAAAKLESLRLYGASAEGNEQLQVSVAKEFHDEVSLIYRRDA